MIEPISETEAKGNFALDIIFSLLSCGIYSIFWQARIFRVMNAFLGEEKFNVWTWCLLSLITCGIYNVFVQYEVARSINSIQSERRLKVNEMLPLLSVALSIFTHHLLTVGFHQLEINAFYDAPKPS